VENQTSAAIFGNGIGTIMAIKSDLICLKIKIGGKLLGYHLTYIYPIQALARILEIEALLQYFFFFQPVQGIAHCSGWKIGLLCNIFLCQKAARFKHFKNKFRRWR